MARSGRRYRLIGGIDLNPGKRRQCQNPYIIILYLVASWHQILSSVHVYLNARSVRSRLCYGTRIDSYGRSGTTSRLLIPCRIGNVEYIYDVHLRECVIISAGETKYDPISSKTDDVDQDTISALRNACGVL